MLRVGDDVGDDIADRAAYLDVICAYRVRATLWKSSFIPHLPATPHATGIRRDDLRDYLLTSGVPRL